MSARVALVGLLAVVSASAAVLSFAALRDLARTCEFNAGLAWLLPVVVDAGAAAGSLVWLGQEAGRAARRFARVLALSLLALSVAANALGHGLAAYQLAPPWWVVVVVSATAPAVLGAVVHLSVLVGRPDATRPDVAGDPADDAVRVVRVDDAPAVPGTPENTAPAADAAAELIAAGAGRRRLARELRISEHEARQLLDRTRRDVDARAAAPRSADTRDGVDRGASTAVSRDDVPDGMDGVGGSPSVSGRDELEPYAAHGAVLLSSGGHGGAR